MRRVFLFTGPANTSGVGELVMRDSIQWAAHQKFVREKVLPAAIRAALAKPMTDEDKLYIEELKRIYDGEPPCR
jgi:hypothetical protein